MPQIIGGIIVLWILAWVVAAVFWVLQWVWAGLVWLWQAILMPFFIYFSPAVVTITITLGLLVGGGIAAHNYWKSLTMHVRSDGSAGTLVRRYIIGILAFFMLSMYSTLLVTGFKDYAYPSGQQFIYEVEEHYGSIEFPAFRIMTFPFWDD